MELRHLRYFVAVAEELHFGRAAERLWIAQPAVSQQIRQLEREVGTRLLARDRRRVELTDAGRVFLDEARQILRHADAAVRAAQQAEGHESARLSVGFVTACVAGALPALLRQLRRRSAVADVSVHELSTAEQARALLGRRIDVGLVYPPLGVEGLAVESLSWEPLAAVLPRDHALARARHVPVAALAREPLVVLAREVGARLYDASMELFRRNEVRPTSVRQVPQLGTVLGIVAGGLGVAVVPQSASAMTHREVVYRPLDVADAVVELAVAWRAEDATRPPVREFVEAARRVVRDQPAAEPPNR